MDPQDFVVTVTWDGRSNSEGTDCQKSPSEFLALEEKTDFGKDTGSRFFAAVVTTDCFAVVELLADVVVTLGFYSESAVVVGVVASLLVAVLPVHQTGSRLDECEPDFAVGLLAE